MAKVGFWLIGAQGSLASTVVLGARAVARRLATGDKFRREQRLDTVIVVNVAATEPSRELTRDHQRLDRFRRAIQDNRRALVTPSMIYAYAALDRGFPYVNFTPSVGMEVPALRELGLKNHVPFYGRDGKTGETLVKTALAPMFRARNLEVLSWEGFNILGGDDGRVLADPRHKRSKVRSKAGVLAERSATRRTRGCGSSTCRRSATGRPPGTSSTSGAFSAPR